MAGSDRRAIFPVVVGAILAATAVSLWLQFREPPVSKPTGDEPAAPLDPTTRPAEPRAADAEPTPLNIRTVDGRDVTAPRLVQRVEPKYPEVARRARMEGMVIVEAVITDRGDVISPRVMKSTTKSILDQCALDAVRQWRYEPARFRGQPVPVYVTVTVTFRLN